MPLCAACHHRDRDTIDHQLIAGTPIRAINAWSKISIGGLCRHKNRCLKDALAQAMRTAQVERAEQNNELLNRVQRLAGEAEEILATAKQEKNLKAATSAICAAVRVLELCGRLDGSLVQSTAPGLHLTLNKTVNITNNYDNDIDFAVMIGEATKNFNPKEIERLKALAESSESAITQP